MSLIADIVKKYPVRFCFLILCTILLLGFEVWGHFHPLPAHIWNIAEVKKINVSDPTNFYFAVFGDNSGCKFVFENLLKLIDHDPDISFAINLGNIVRDGKKEEYYYFLNQVRNYLDPPLLTAMGNHEVRGRGRKLYHAIFGPSYYSFHIGKNYFIVLDDANKTGLDTQQRRWLEKELTISTSYDSRTVFMHVPLYDPRGGNFHHCLPKESSDFLTMLFQKYRVTYIFASHIHGYFKGAWKGIPYTISGGAGAKLDGDDPAHYFFHFLKVHIKDSKVDIQAKHVLPADYKWLGIFSYKAWYRLLYLYTFFRTYGIELALLLLIGSLIMVVYRPELRLAKLSRNKTV